MHLRSLVGNHAYDLYSSIVFLARTCNIGVCDSHGHQDDGVSRVDNIHFEDRKSIEHLEREIVSPPERVFASGFVSRGLSKTVHNYLPIMHDAVLCRTAFVSLAKGVAESLISSLKRDPERMCFQVLKYTKIGLKMNMEYVKKIIPPKNS